MRYKLQQNTLSVKFFYADTAHFDKKIIKMISKCVFHRTDKIHGHHHKVTMEISVTHQKRD